MNHLTTELGFIREKHWRPMQAIGAIHGLPTFSGKAIATDGMLVVIEKPDGSRVIGHLSSFEPVKKEKTGNGSKREKKPDVNEGLFE